jgi:hypothetical protein
MDDMVKRRVFSQGCSQGLTRFGGGGGDAIVWGGGVIPVVLPWGHSCVYPHCTSGGRVKV